MAADAPVVLPGASSDTGGTAVTVVAEVATCPAVVHADVHSALMTEIRPVAVVIAVSAVHVPGMAATIGGIEVRTSEVEIVTIRIAGIDAEVPVACLPVERAVEIAGGDECLPLPIEEDITQVEVTTLPIGAEHVVAASHTHEVVEIDLVGGLILLVGEVELVGHLVGQEQSLIAGLLETHCVG